MTTRSATGTLAGRYAIDRVLGSGSFGRTFLARERLGGRPVAIKMLNGRGQEDWKAYELFQREADVLRTLRHHGIPEVFETFEDTLDGTRAAFVAMEYVEGRSLAQIIDEKRPLDASQVMHLFLELLGILDYLHSRVPPILHRDIKPSNIIVRPNGFPALVDFGSVRRVFMTADETGSTVAGTYGYMPYEQYMGQATPASDLYAAAATFLHLMTGRAPREFMTEEGRIEVPADLSHAPLRNVIARLLRPAPSERFASAREVRDALVSAPSSLAAISALPSPIGVRQLNESFALVGALPPAPRSLTGDTNALLRRVAPSAFRLMTASEKNTEDWGIADILSLAFFSIITAGILPTVFWNLARARHRRLKRFFEFGDVTHGTITRIELETTAFDEKLARVSYQFDADGQTHRDSDVMLPTIADRLQPGDRVPLLFLRDRNYDSVIVAAE